MLKYNAENMKSIPELVGEIKAGLDAGLSEWGLIAIVLLASISSFGLGRLSMLEEVKPSVSIRQAPSADKPASIYIGGLIEASRSGSVYYYPWCAGAAKITPAKQVWFADEAAAKRAGYAPAKNCKGLGGD